MADTTLSKTDRIVRVGPDQVTVRDQQLIVEAKHPMPDWQVRELNLVPIYFEDKKYYLAEKRKAAPPYAIRYLLLPWPEGEVTNAKSFYCYDEETVEEREANRRTTRFEEIVRGCLLPLYPFLGLLWSGAQNRLVRFGFVPHVISGVSVFTAYCLLFAQGVFVTVMLNVSGRSGALMLGGLIRALVDQDYVRLGPVVIPVGLVDGLLLLALMADVPVRYDHYLREPEWSGGFLEWLVPAAARKK